MHFMSNLFDLGTIFNSPSRSPKVTDNSANQQLTHVRHTRHYFSPESRRIWENSTIEKHCRKYASKLDTNFITSYAANYNTIDLVYTKNHYT